jgi:hypothetical protein
MIEQGAHDMYACTKEVDVSSDQPILLFGLQTSCDIITVFKDEFCVGSCLKTPRTFMDAHPAEFITL